LLEKVIINNPSLTQQEITELRPEVSAQALELTFQDAREFLLPVIGSIVLSGFLVLFLGKV